MAEMAEGVGWRGFKCPDSSGGPCSVAAAKGVSEGDDGWVRFCHTLRSDRRSTRRRGSAALQERVWRRYDGETGLLHR